MAKIVIILQSHGYASDRLTSIHFFHHLLQFGIHLTDLLVLQLLQQPSLNVQVIEYVFLLQTIIEKALIYFLELLKNELLQQD